MKKLFLVTVLASIPLSVPAAWDLFTLSDESSSNAALSSDQPSSNVQLSLVQPSSTMQFTSPNRPSPNIQLSFLQQPSSTVPLTLDQLRQSPGYRSPAMSDRFSTMSSRSNSLESPSSRTQDRLEGLLDIEIPFHYPRTRTLTPIPSRAIPPLRTNTPPIASYRAVQPQESEEFEVEVSNPMKKFKRIDTQYRWMNIEFNELLKKIRRLNNVDIENQRQKIRAWESEKGLQLAELERRIKNTSLQTDEAAHIRAEINELLKHKQTLYDELTTLTDYKRSLMRQQEDLGLKLNELERERDELIEVLGIEQDL
ncbi:MAG TPA: hypothetical protein VLG50_06040 [Candidatus Saccharimonadales bacterium]|nr:hypothetical protein [Candidatus Saccharimonadales bacterium]